jgi:Nuclease-related domain
MMSQSPGSSDAASSSADRNMSLTRRPGGVQAYKLIIPDRRAAPEPQTHEGYEWLYVLDGRLRLSLRVWTSKRQVPRQPIPAAGHTDLEEKLIAGIAGEQLVAVELGRALDDDWTLLRGYRNRRGEIDHLLLGPRGLFAIEVKNLNATVHVDGDRWRADKYDNYGNLVEQRPIADRKGRPPSVQLNEPADDLERFLRERGQPVQVQRVVILAHRRSRLGAVRNPGVLVATSTGDVLSLISNSADQLSRDQQAAIQRLIQHDHEFHGKRPRSGKPRPGRPPPR